MTILEKVCCEKKFVNTEKVAESFCPNEDRDFESLLYEYGDIDIKDRFR